MEKKFWTPPRINFVEFAANEYVSSCRDDKGYTFYKFICDATLWDAPTNSWIYMDNGSGISGRIYRDSNSNGVWDESDTFDGPFKGCGASTSGEGDESHILSSQYFYSGFYIPTYYVSGRDEQGNVTSLQETTGDLNNIISVTVWNGDGNLHASHNIDYTTMEAARS